MPDFRHGAPAGRGHQALPGRRFDTSSSQAVLLPDLSGRGKTAFQLPRFATIAVANQYLRLSAEVEHRVANREAFLAGTLGPVHFDRLAVAPAEDGAGPDAEQLVVANG